jgi:hypothetical protein
MRLSGGRLLVLDRGGDQQLLAINPQSGEILKRTGQRGNALGELEHPWTLQPVGRSAAVWVYDISQGRLTLIDMGETKGQAVRRSVAISPNVYTEPVWTADDELVSPGLFISTGRLAVLDTIGHLKRYIGRIPAREPAQPPRILQQAFQAVATTNGDRDLIAVATRYADRLEIYDRVGRLRSSAPRSLGFEPTYHVIQHKGREIFSANADLRYGFVDLVDAGDLLFALFSGRTAAEAGKAASLGQQIQVYRWNGTLVATYRLMHPAISIAVSQDLRTVFALDADTPGITAYGLPALPR